MTNKLKHLRSTLNQTVFREDHFKDESKKRVIEKIQQYQERQSSNILQFFKKGYKPLLSVLACSLLLVCAIGLVFKYEEQKTNQALKNSTAYVNHQTIQNVTTAEKKAVTQLATHFKKAEYEVDYRKIHGDVLQYMKNRCKPYLLKESYEKIDSNQNFKMQSEAAVYFKSVISVENINFSHFQKRLKEGSIDFDYRIFLDMKQERGDTKKVYQIPLSGHMTVIKTEKGWKVKKDLSDKIPNEELK